MLANLDNLSILEKIYLGKFSKNDYPKLTNENIYKIILDDLFFECTGDHKYHRANNTITKCHGDENKKPSLIVKDLRDNLDKKQLNNLFDVLNQLKTEMLVIPYQLVNKSLSLVAYCNSMYEVKINDSSSTFSENDVLTASRIAKFFTSLFQINNITEYNTFQVKHVNNPNSRYNFTLGDSGNIHIFLDHFLKFSHNLFIRFKMDRYLPLEKNIMEFFKNFGDLGFQLKIKDESQYQYQADLVMYNAENIISKLWNCSDILKKSAVLTFLNRYHEIKDIDVIKQDCRDVFKFANCSPIYEKILKNTITTGDFSDINYQLVMDYLLGYSNDIKHKLNSLTGTNKLPKIINFFKDYLIKNNTLDEVYLKKTFDFCNFFSEIALANNTLLRNADNKLDIKMIQSQIALVLNLVKSNTKEKLLENQADMISQLGDLVVDIIKNYQEYKFSNLTNEVANIPKSYLDIINYCKDIDYSLIESAKFFTNSIIKVTKTCLNSHVCKNIQIKKQSFEMLGGMTRRLENIHRIHLAREVINSAKELKNIVASSSNISNADLGSDVVNFLRARYSRNQVLMNKDCKDLFDLNPQDCQPFIPSNTTLSISNTTPSNLIPLAVNTTNAPPINQTILTIIADPTAVTELSINLNSTSSNQTIVDTANEKNTDASLASPGLTLGAAAAHGAGTGMLNGIIQYFATKYSRQGEQSSKAKVIFIYSSLLAHAAFAATFPLMLYKIQEHINQGNEDEAQELWNNLMLQAPLTFISSIGLNVGLQAAYKCTQLLSNRAVRAIAQNTLPLAGTAVSLFENPVATAVQMATSIAMSSLTYGLFNRISPVNNINSLNIEKANVDNVELKSNTGNDLKPTVNVIVESEIIEKTYLYITKEKLDDIRNQSKDIITLLNALVCSLQKSIENDKSKINSDTNPAVADTYQTIIDNKTQLLQIIKQEVEKCNTEISLLNDDHEEGYKKHVIKNTHNPEEKKKIKEDYISAMNKLGNVFKRMEPMFNYMTINLGKANGYVEGASKSFAGDDTLFSLNKIIDKIQFPLSLIKNYISAYNTWDAAEKGEKNGAKKALENTELFEKSIQPNNSQITSRPIKSRLFNNRPQSVTSDSRTHSSGSENEENPLIARPLLKF